MSLGAVVLRVSGAITSNGSNKIGSGRHDQKLGCWEYVVQLALQRINLGILAALSTGQTNVVVARSSNLMNDVC